MNNGSGKRKHKATSKARLKIEPSTGNVFADLSLPNPGELLAKAELAQAICDIVAERRLTQTTAASILGIDQPKVSALMRGKLAGFSTDRLLRFINALGRDIDIIIRPASQGKKTAGIHVVPAAKAS